ITSVPLEPKPRGEDDLNLIARSLRRRVAGLTAGAGPTGLSRGRPAHAAGWPGCGRRDSAVRAGWPAPCPRLFPAPRTRTAAGRRAGCSAAAERELRPA